MKSLPYKIKQKNWNHQDFSRKDSHRLFNLTSHVSSRFQTIPRGRQNYLHLRGPLPKSDWSNTRLTPRKTNECPLKKDQFSRKYIFHPLMFRGHGDVFWGVSQQNAETRSNSSIKSIVFALGLAPLFKNCPQIVTVLTRWARMPRVRQHDISSLFAAKECSAPVSGKKTSYQYPPKM